MDLQQRYKQATKEARWAFPVVFLLPMQDGLIKGKIYLVFVKKTKNIKPMLLYGIVTCIFGALRRKLPGRTKKMTAIIRFIAMIKIGFI